MYVPTVPKIRYKVGTQKGAHTFFGQFVYYALNVCIYQVRPCGLMDKAPDFGSGDCRFESCHGRKGAQIFGRFKSSAQIGRQRPENWALMDAGNAEIKFLPF